MKRLSIVSFACSLVLLLALAPRPSHAIPYNHVNADGIWGVGEWDVSAERRCVNTTTPYGANDGNVQSILVTWDHDSLYIGVEGNTWNNAELIYIDSDGITSAPYNKDFFKGFTTPGWNPDFVFGAYNMQYGDVIGGNPQFRKINADSSTSVFASVRYGVKDKNSDGGHLTGLVEIAIPWSVLGVHPGGRIKVAAGTGFASVKTPHVDPAGGLGGESGDELCGTDQVGGTDAISSTLDTPASVNYDLNLDGVPDSYLDSTPPFVLSASSNSPAPNYTGAHNQVLVSFSEIVKKATVEVPSNYTLQHALGFAVPATAVRQADSSTVLLTFVSPITLGFTNKLTVTGVQDRAGNTILANGTANVGCFCIRRLVLRANMSLHLRTDSPADSFVVIGNTLPLDFSNVCKIKLNDSGTNGDATAGDSIWSTTIDFSRSQVCGAGPDTTTLEYEFNHRCSEYEGLHHVFAMTCGNAVDTLNTFWKDISPADYTTHAIDVVFKVDAYTEPGQRISIDGSQQPLSWSSPSPTHLRNDGVAPDSSANDKRWSGKYRFPKGTLRNVDFKYLIDDTTYECGGNRNVVLNDALFDTTGSVLGPLVITPVGIFGQNCATATGVGRPPVMAPRLFPNRPNPFGRSTEIGFRAPVSADVDVSIYDMSGRHLRTLMKGRVAAGEQRVTWDGRDNSGRRLPSGVYFYQLTSGGFSEQRRMLLVH